MMMVVSDDLDLSQLGESVKDEVRRRIMQQEVEFRDQVRELHRLYWTQKNFMRELQRKEQSTKAALVVDSSKEVKGKFIDINEDLPTGFDFGFLDKKGEGKRSVLPERSSLYCYEVIDLVEPGESGIRVGGNVVASNSFEPLINRGGELHSLRPPISDDVPSSSRVRNEHGLVPLGHFLHAGHDERWREQRAPISGSGFQETSAAAFIDSSTDLTQKEPPPSSRPLLIDLNIAQDDEPSHDFNNHILNFSSPSSSSSVIEHELPWKDEGSNKCYKVTGALLKPVALNSALEISKEKKKEWWLPGCHSQNSEVRETIQSQEHEVGNKAQGSDSNGSAECSRNVVEEFSSCPIASSGRLTTLSSAKLSKPLDENANSSSDKQTSISHSSRRQASIITSSNYIEVKQLNCSGSEEDTVSSHAIALQDEKEDIGGSAISHDKSIGGNSGTTAEMDFEMTAAADALVCISLQKLLSLVDKFDNTGPSIDINGGEDKNDEPQYSSDSFELMTLKLPEIKSEHLMVTKPVENEARSGASGVKRLRRGRAVRDFQKDILPGIVSLSRHEICEDMHNIGYQLRKNGSRKTCEDSWFVPVRSRRSRRNCAGQRH